MKKIKDRTEAEIHPKSLRLYETFVNLIEELQGRDLPDFFIAKVDPIIQRLNDTDLAALGGKKEIHKARKEIVKALEKELKIVPKNYYRNLWMVLGMSALGIPFGVLFGSILDNMALMGIGIPIGMSIGLAIGFEMDETAKKEGRQLSFEIEF